MEPTNNIRILITAGGGGHFAPALAVIKLLKQREHCEIAFVGRKYAFEGDTAESFEYKTVEKLDIPFRTITAGRLQRTLQLRSFLALLKIPVGLYQAIRVVRDLKPDVILSFGGYIALPVTVVGRMLGIPVVIHEQTMRAGLANRISGMFADKICLSFESSTRYFPKDKTLLTGNPLRDEITAAKKQDVLVQGREKLLFITGGSLGSHAINVLFEGILEKLLNNYRIIHQTGDAQEFKDYDRLKAIATQLPSALQKRYYVSKFLTPAEMAASLSHADLVVGRSGMNTVSELIYYQKPALLIPLPYGQRNEQLENANYLQSLGLAVVKNQDDLTHETVYTEIERMMDELSTYKLKKDYHALIHTDAAEKIIAVVLSLTQKLPQNSEEKKEA